MRFSFDESIKFVRLLIVHTSDHDSNIENAICSHGHGSMTTGAHIEMEYEKKN